MFFSTDNSLFSSEALEELASKTSNTYFPGLNYDIGLEIPKTIHQLKRLQTKYSFYVPKNYTDILKILDNITTTQTDYFPIKENLDWLFKQKNTKIPFIICPISAIRKDSIIDEDNYIVMYFSEFYNAIMNNQHLIQGIKNEFNIKKIAAPLQSEYILLDHRIRSKGPQFNCLCKYKNFAPISFEQMNKYITVSPGIYTLETQYETNFDWFMNQTGSEELFTIIELITPDGSFSWAIDFYKFIEKKL